MYVLLFKKKNPRALTDLIDFDYIYYLLQYNHRWIVLWYWKDIELTPFYQNKILYIPLKCYKSKYTHSKATLSAILVNNYVVLNSKIFLSLPINFYLRRSPEWSYRSFSIGINHAAFEITYLKDVIESGNSVKSEKPVNKIIYYDYVISERVS